jgi:PAS domain S-box-containing protein
MDHAGEKKRQSQPAASIVLGYGLAAASVAAAFALADAFPNFHLPQLFAAFALFAIAITFWLGGTVRGILAALASAFICSYFFGPEINLESRVLYGLAFLIFALLMRRITRARYILEARIADRKTELTRTNEDLKLEIAERKRAEEALSLFRALIDQSSDAIEVIDPSSLRILDMNQKACADHGYTRDEILSLTIFDIDPTVDQDQYVSRLNQLRESGSFIKEGVHLRKDGSTFPVEINVRLIELESRGYVVAVARDITGRKQAEEELRRLSVQLLQSQDEERRNIARDLHDTTAQNLIALKATLGVLYRSLSPTDVVSRDSISDCQALAAQAIHEVRTLSYVLHPPMLEEAGLAVATRLYVDGFAKRSGIAVDLEVAANFGRLKPEIELALFRVIQESLTNIHRHSGSVEARIRLDRQGDDAVAEIIDHGLGVRDGENPHEIGVGISSMQERVRQIGGRLVIDYLSSGTTVRVTLAAGNWKREEISSRDC